MGVVAVVVWLTKITIRPVLLVQGKRAGGA